MIAKYLVSQPGLHEASDTDEKKAGIALGEDSSCAVEKTVSTATTTKSAIISHDQGCMLTVEERKPFRRLVLRLDPRSFIILQRCSKQYCPLESLLVSSLDRIVLRAAMIGREFVGSGIA